jgi:hypothetical protein
VVVPEIFSFLTGAAEGTPELGYPLAVMLAFQGDYEEAQRVSLSASHGLFVQAGGAVSFCVCGPGCAALGGIAGGQIFDYAVTIFTRQTYGQFAVFNAFKEDPSIKTGTHIVISLGGDALGGYLAKGSPIIPSTKLRSKIEETDIKNLIDQNPKYEIQITDKNMKESPEMWGPKKGGKREKMKIKPSSTSEMAVWRKFAEDEAEELWTLWERDLGKMTCRRRRLMAMGERRRCSASYKTEYYRLTLMRATKGLTKKSVVQDVYQVMVKKRVENMHAEHIIEGQMWKLAAPSGKLKKKTFEYIKFKLVNDPVNMGWLEPSINI